jgi:hypothetical protein
MICPSSGDTVNTQPVFERGQYRITCPGCKRSIGFRRSNRGNGVIPEHSSVEKSSPRSGSMKLTPLQEGIVRKMQRGGQLVKYPIHCGDPSSFSLQFKEERSERPDKRSVNALIKRGFVGYSGQHKGRFPVYHLTEIGRKL